MSLLDLQGIKSPKGGKGGSDDCPGGGGGGWPGIGQSGLSLLIC